MSTVQLQARLAIWSPPWLQRSGSASERLRLGSPAESLPKAVVATSPATET